VDSTGSGNQPPVVAHRAHVEDELERARRYVDRERLELREVEALPAERGRAEVGAHHVRRVELHGNRLRRRVDERVGRRLLHLAEGLAGKRGDPGARRDPERTGREQHQLAEPGVERHVPLAGSARHLDADGRPRVEVVRRLPVEVGHGERIQDHRIGNRGPVELERVLFARGGEHRETEDR